MSHSSMAGILIFVISLPAANARASAAGKRKIFITVYFSPFAIPYSIQSNNFGSIFSCISAFSCNVEL